LASREPRPPGHHHRLARWGAAALVGIAALIVAVHLLLDPVATHFTRKGLAASKDVHGEFLRVHVTVAPPGYTIDRLKLIQAHGGDWRQPLFYAERMRATLDWRELLHARLAAHVRIDRPKIVVIQTPAPAEGDKKAKREAKPPDVGAALRRLVPARLVRLDVRDGEVLFRDAAAPRQPELWLHDIDLSLRNLATRRRLMHGRAATLDLHAKLGHSGVVTSFVSADPLAHQPRFSGDFAVRGWEVAELYDLEEPKTKLQTPSGTLDIYAKFKAAGGAISGGVKPELKDVKVRPAEKGFGNKIKAWVADEGLHIFSHKEKNGEREAATIIPIEGRLDAPDIQLWPTVLGVLRNAFVEGITSGFAYLPPPASEKKEGKLHQLRDALTKDKGPPKAQPPDDSKKDEGR
jgi:hypothetical protein